jgi:SAM-dependent methyltransferase
MTFVISADSYDRYMGRYSRELAPRLVEFGRVEPGMRVVDVGCGPGPLTEALAARLGADNVAAADPSELLVAACADRVPEADVRLAPAEQLPWPNDSFDAAFSQLVVNFMRNARAGVGEMRRVVREGGAVTSCTWDYSEGMRMLRIFWDAAVALDPEAPDEGRTMQFQRPEELEALWREVGLGEIETAPLDVAVDYESFDDYWEPFTTGTAPGGAYCASLTPERRVALREECRRRLGNPQGPFRLPARAWAVRGRLAD